MHYKITGSIYIVGYCLLLCKPINTYVAKTKKLIVSVDAHDRNLINDPFVDVPFWLFPEKPFINHLRLVIKPSSTFYVLFYCNYNPDFVYHVTNEKNQFSNTSLRNSDLEAH